MRGTEMNIAVKKQIISELDSLPDQKGYSLLDYLHFLKQDKNEYEPNQETIKAIQEKKESLHSYSSTDELFNDLSIEV